MKIRARYSFLLAACAAALLTVFNLALRDPAETAGPAIMKGGAAVKASDDLVNGALPARVEALQASTAAARVEGSSNVSRVDAAATGVERFIVRVIDEQEQPVAGAVVYRKRLSRESIRELERTDAQGRAALDREHFPVEKQSLFAVAPGGKFTRSCHAGRSPTWPGPIVLQVPAPPSEPGCFGRVTRAVDGAPINGASVALYPAPRIRADGGFAGIFAPDLAPATTDVEGRFTLPFIGRFSSVETLIVSAPGYAPSQVRWAEVTSSEERQEPVDVELKPLVKRRGRVRFQDGAPARGVTVGLRPSAVSFGWQVSTEADQEGRFELLTSPDEVKIEAFFHPYASDTYNAPQIAAGEVDQEPAPIELELPCDSTTRVLLEVPPGVDRAGLSLYIEDEFGIHEYPWVEESVPVYVLSATEARLLLAAKGSRPFESFDPVASAENVNLKSDVTQTVKLKRPATGTLKVELGPDLQRRLGAPKEVHLFTIEPGARPYSKTVPMEGSKLSIDDVPAQPIQVAVIFQNSFELRARSVEAAPGEVITVLFER